jgi:probable phosphoglycerate mutase
MNYLESVAELANRYFVMRHGQSKANVAGVIVSRIDADRGDFGLSALGREQVRTAVTASGLPAGTMICSSDFSRARETAEIVREVIGAPAVTLAEALRERYFGDWDGTGTGNYATVWADDEAGRTGHGAEPVTGVLDRTTAFVARLEKEHQDQDILLVSHGDALQILQAGFQHLDPARHRSLPHLETAEIRRLGLSRGLSTR